MEYIDFILAIPLLWGAIIGFKKGLILELATIVALILGILGAIKFSDLTADYLNQTFEIDVNWIGLISFLVTFVGIVIAVSLLGRILDKALKLAALGIVNRLLGLVFGLLKYTLLVSVGLFFFDNVNKKINLTDSDLAEVSFLYTPIKMVTEPIKPLLDEVSLESLDDIDISLELP